MSLTNRFKLSAQKFEQLKRNLPRQIAALCVSFFLDAFRKEGWTDEGFRRWKPRQAKRTVKRSGQGRNILVKSGRLRREVGSSIKMATWNRIRFEVNVPYAHIHNAGFVGQESVESYTRRIKGEVQVFSTRTKRRTTVSATVGETQVKAHTRHMVMPQRKFMGHSAVMKRKISELIQRELKKVMQ